MALHVETDLAGGDWPGHDWQALARAAVAAALAQTPHAEVGDAGYALEVGVRLADDGEVHGLNLQYRHKDKPTNVLSFPMLDADLIDTLANTDDGEVLLGDIVLADGVVRAEAAAKGWPLGGYVQHLIVHGTLHLLGYDHELGPHEASVMEAMETAACRTLGLPDPYAEHD